MGLLGFQGFQEPKRDHRFLEGLDQGIFFSVARLHMSTRRFVGPGCKGRAFSHAIKCTSLEIYHLNIELGGFGLDQRLLLEFRQTTDFPNKVAVGAPYPVPATVGGGQMTYL